MKDQSIKKIMGMIYDWDLNLLCPLDCSAVFLLYLIYTCPFHVSIFVEG
jgi:hypothetical protein